MWKSTHQRLNDALPLASKQPEDILLAERNESVRCLEQMQARTRFIVNICEIGHSIEFVSGELENCKVRRNVHNATEVPDVLQIIPYPGSDFVPLVIAPAQHHPPITHHVYKSILGAADRV